MKAQEAQELQKKTMPELVAIYNGFSPAKPAGAKTFSNKKTAVDRILAIKPSTNGKAATKVVVKAKDKKVKTLETTSNRSVRQVSEELILEDSPALTYEQIVLKVKEELSNSSTTVACMRWYATQMRERGEQVPDRPRKPKGVTLLS
jgi:hypothetical protein